MISVIIGGGAAGFFGAIACASLNSNHKVILLEKHRQLLSKVRISGGGRCNVTHACFDPALLVQNYPRGSKALRGPFTRFQPKDTIEWFESRGVKLKVESDGRMFPTTDSSETIIQCLMQEAKKVGVDIRLEQQISNIQKEGTKFVITLPTEKVECDNILIATGSHPKGHEWIKNFGHTIEPLVPSLFTFNVPDSPLLEFSGISLPKTHLQIENTNLEQTGPLLMTHWGFSGPAVLKLSAWGARILHDLNYKAVLRINWLPDYSQNALREKLKNNTSNKFIVNEPLPEIPRNLWRKLVSLAEISDEQRWTNLSKSSLEKMINQLQASRFSIQGKTTFKEEFVTCGGVNLNEVDFKTMQSRLCPGLYFAGEVLDIDGITGGFNFQNAWTTSWIAGQSMNLSRSE